MPDDPTCEYYQDWPAKGGEVGDGAGPFDYSNVTIGSCKYFLRITVKGQRYIRPGGNDTLTKDFWTRVHLIYRFTGGTSTGGAGGGGSDSGGKSNSSGSGHSGSSSSGASGSCPDFTRDEWSTKLPGVFILPDLLNFHHAFTKPADWTQFAPQYLNGVAGLIPATALPECS